MHITEPRLSLALLALIASASIAQAQTPDPRQSGSPARRSPSEAGMIMPEATGPGDQPGAMGKNMGRMMDTMRPMMAGHAGMGMPFEHVEGRIAYLKAELKITDAQSAPWNAYADTMRAEATMMKSMHDEAMKEGAPTTALDRMAARHKMMSARIGMLERSEAAAKPLYASLSEEQRKAFDEMAPCPMGMMGMM